MLAIRIPWLAIAGPERFFVPPTEVEFYLGQTMKYASILSVMLFLMVKFRMGPREIGLGTTFRQALGDIVHGGMFSLFYVLITWVLTLVFLRFIPSNVEAAVFDPLFGYVMPPGKMLELMRTLDPAVYAAFMTIVPAVVEEMYFRGYSVGLLRRLFGNLWTVNLIQSSLFSALHWYRGLVAGMLPMFIFGFLFGFLTIRNGFRLTSAMTGHLIVNALSVSLYLRGLENIG